MESEGGPPSRHPFDAALEEFEPEAAEETTHRPFFATVSTLAVAAAELSRPHSGVHWLWESAAEWTPPADPPPPQPPPEPAPATPKPSARAEDIAGELGLAKLISSIDVAQARRRFMWDNHPDRRGDLDRELANRRVAIANMLLDRRLDMLARRRRGR
jgi:hypothetical protein